ncbi:MAG: hypothetical protein L3K26_11345, partial [Candidatus Hydrogenedentes bacterium]|nr:hypothetical protein [Candidatus Hydrogenedentota bacterium]
EFMVTANVAAAEELVSKRTPLLFRVHEEPSGEKLDALDVFHPRRMADQILGMGDIVSLVEKAQEVVDKDEAVKFQKKVKKGDLDLEDFLAQMRQVKKMGSMGDLMKKIPGMGKILGPDMDTMNDAAEEELKYTEAIILSMTPRERHRPKVINGSRRRRIAMGSGTSVQEVNRLLKDFEKMKKMMKRMMKGGGRGSGRGRATRGAGPRGFR